jgi:uncharacterized membrane-anchored protein YitT (DUF2179 family)
MDRRGLDEGESPRSMFGPQATPVHTRFDDAQALVTGTLFVALGISMYQSAGLLTGGTAGLAFLVHYATGWPFGAVFFAINLPFYALALRAMGVGFTAKTFVAIALVSLATDAMPRVLAFGALQPWFGAVMGGILIGVGLLMLFRHHASLGGVNVLALFLQERRGWPAGKVQMAVDCAIVAAAFAYVPPAKVALSVLGAVALNLVVAVNHKPGRYLGV